MLLDLVWSAIWQRVVFIRELRLDGCQFVDLGRNLLPLGRVPNRMCMIGNKCVTKLACVPRPHCSCKHHHCLLYNNHRAQKQQQLQR